MRGSSRSMRIALVGNPNTGKSSLFNSLTGLNQKVSNYPGITVEKKTGFFKLPNGNVAEITDLPGTYSLNPSSLDEAVVLNFLANPKKNEKPDGVIVVIDATNIKRNLYLLSQVLDLNFPTIVVLNMMDMVERKGIEIDVEKLSSIYGVPFIPMTARKGIGSQELKNQIIEYKPEERSHIYNVTSNSGEWLRESLKITQSNNAYASWLLSIQEDGYSQIADDKREQIKLLLDRESVNKNKERSKEAIKRYQFVNQSIKEAVKVNPDKDRSFTARIDRVLTHKVFGLLILFAVLAIIFQAVFAWAEGPMNFIDESFSHLSIWVKGNLTPGPLTNLISDGLIPGVAGVVIFIPQIAILFTFIGVLEESGYMARVVLLMDKIMSKFGLSGKSVVPLISGTACAIPAIMATRNIENWKERLITILVTPFTTCSARLPVYIILISLIIPDQRFLGFNIQGLALMVMYLIGFLAALIGGYVLSRMIGVKSSAPFIIEMPSYRLPLYKNLFYTVIEKSKSFVVGAGKIIIALSVVLWILATNGPSKSYDLTDQQIEMRLGDKVDSDRLTSQIESYRLENSYIGILGKAIEPAIKPLGYDWKIGISLITSFAAREVFVGSIATIYSVGAEDETTIVRKMKNEINPDTGKPFFTSAVGMSLLIFYAFAMQCVSTFAVVKKETNSWTWPIFQLVFMSAFAYLMSFITFTLLK